MLSKLRQVLVLGCVALAAAACGGSVVEVEAEDAGADSTSLPPAQTPAVESDGGISPEEQEADDLALLAASELTISGEASASAVLDSLLVLMLRCRLQVLLALCLLTLCCRMVCC